MGGIVGRLFREFAVTLSVAILISLLISLTTTPMMCAFLLRDEEKEEEPQAHAKPSHYHRIARRMSAMAEAALDWLLRGYARSLD
jgi:multidrug efflux pump